MSAPNLNPQNDAVLHLPGTLLSEIESLAQSEHIDAAGVVKQALRSLRILQARHLLEQIHEELPPTPYRPEDVPRLLREVRAEMRAEEQSARRP